MGDFPRSLQGFEAQFPDDEACARWLLAKRWPDGFRCPACGHDRGWELGRGVAEWTVTQIVESWCGRMDSNTDSRAGMAEWTVTQIVESWCGRVDSNTDSRELVWPSGQ